MAKFKENKQEQPKWYPTNNDVADLKEKLRPFKQTRINGKLQTPFNQYCKTVGVIGFDEYGERIVYSPGDYKRLSDIYERGQTQENAANEAFLDQHPEERAKLFAKIKGLFKLSA